MSWPYQFKVKITLEGQRLNFVRIISQSDLKDFILEMPCYISLVQEYIWVVKS